MGDTSSVTFGDSFPSKGKPSAAVRFPKSVLKLTALPCEGKVAREGRMRWRHLIQNSAESTL